MSQLFTSGGQSIGASASVLSMNIQEMQELWDRNELGLFEAIYINYSISCIRPLGLKCSGWRGRGLSWEQWIRQKSTKKEITFRKRDTWGFFCLFVYYYFLLYNIVLVLPYINMNLPRVYTCSPSWTPSHLPPYTIPLGHLHQPQASCTLHQTWTGVCF